MIAELFNFSSMTALEIIAQLLGFGGTIMNFVSYQMNERKKILGCQMIAALFFVASFLCLGAYTGMAMNFLGMLRALVYTNNDKKWAKPTVWMPIFFAAFAAATALTWDGAISLLPMVAMMLATVSLSLKNPTYIRIVTFPTSPCWLIYNVFCRSYAGILTEAMVMFSIVSAAVRYDVIPWIRKRKKK